MGTELKSLFVYNLYFKLIEKALKNTYKMLP